MSDAFEKAWYDNVNPYTRHIREDFQDSVRQPGVTGPTGMDRANFIEPNRWYRQNDPDYETGWTGDDLPLKIARLSLEQNDQLHPNQLLNLAESEEDIQWMVDNGHLPALFTDSEEGKQARIDLESGAKTMEDLVRETLKDGYKPAGTYNSGYFMPDNVLQGLDVADRMRAVINARLMDVPVKQLRQLVDDYKTSAPKLMETWHESTKPYGAFTSGEWEGYTPLSRGAKATTSKNLTGLGVESPIFRDLISRLGKKPEALKIFRRLLSAEASDLLNTMDERRELDSLNVGRFGTPMIGPQEDMGDIKVREEPLRGYRGQDDVRGPFEEDFQIMNRSNDAFEDAWNVAKADTGMWDEIYAPLYDIFGGERGRNTNDYAIPLDFIQTKDLPLERHHGGKNAMALQDYQDDYIEFIMQDILEHGMMGRDSHWWHRDGQMKRKKDLTEGRARFDKNKAGISNPGNVSIPKIGFTPDGWKIDEGNHRVHALRRLNAPYIPAYSEGTFFGKPKSFSSDLPMGAEMRRWMGKPQEEPRDPYGFQTRLRDGKYRIPPSFLFGRELVPGMGKLIPDLPEGLTASDMPLDELKVRGGEDNLKSKLKDWQYSPKWRIEE